MSDKEKKIYQYMIYGVSGFIALFSLIFGICYCSRGGALSGCLIMFFGFTGSVGAYLLLTFLFSIACDLKAKKNVKEKEEVNLGDTPKAE